MTHDTLSQAILTARVPRYTSYPPADRFSDTIGPQDKADWLQSITPGSAISLYAHVPYCRRLCWFWACRTQGTKSDAPLDRYLDHLAREITLTRRQLPGDIDVLALHLGGGTPTLLSPDRIARLGAMVKGAFDLSAAEISVEIDPCECVSERLDALTELGLSRASIGVQDFDPVVQASIGRIQSHEATLQTVQGLRDRDIASVNFDLLYGLPHQTPDRMKRTLDAVCDMAPERIALYGYAHVPWVARRQKLIPEAALPTPEERLALTDLARDRLIAAGYVAVGIDHFALPTDSLAIAARNRQLRRNFQGYTTDRATTLVALGPSAISLLPQGFVQNAPRTDEWQSMTNDGLLPATRGIALSDRDRAIGAVIERLMCDGQVDLAFHGGADGDLIAEAAQTALDRFTGAGQIIDGLLRLNDIRASRLVPHAIETTLTGQTESGMRYSQAS